MYIIPFLVLGGIFAKIVNMALDKKPKESVASNLPSPHFVHDEEKDTDFHETLPKEILKIKDITILKNVDQNKTNNVEVETNKDEKQNLRNYKNLSVKLEDINDRTEKKAVVANQNTSFFDVSVSKSKSFKVEDNKIKSNENKKINEKQISESTTQSRQSDSISSVIPVIMISTTESDEETLQRDRGIKYTKTKEKKHREYVRGSRAHNEDAEQRSGGGNAEVKSLRRQSSVDSIEGGKASKGVKCEEGPSYQYSL